LHRKGQGKENEGDERQYLRDITGKNVYNEDSVPKSSDENKCNTIT
jgi:hypothetical protein